MFYAKRIRTLGVIEDREDHRMIRCVSKCICCVSKDQPFGADVFLHRDSEILWNDQSTNDASSSSSKIPKLKHSPDHEAENQLTVSRGMGYVQVYAPFINNIHDQNHQNRNEQKQPTVEMPQIPSANAVYPITTVKFLLRLELMRFLCLARTTTPRKCGRDY